MSISTNVRVGLGVVLCISVIFRLVGLNNEALWTDEAWTLVLSLWTPLEMLTLPTDPSPVLYYAVHSFLFDPNDPAYVVRLLPMAFGVASVGVMYLIGRSQFGPWGGLVSAALLAVWSSHVDYSMEARAYSALFFFCLLVLLGFLIFWNAVRVTANKGRVSWKTRSYGLGLLAIGCVGAFYTHVSSVFVIAYFCAALGLGVLLFARENIVSVAMTYVLMLVLVIPNLFWFVQVQGTDHQFNWLAQPSLETVISTLADFFFPIGFWDNPVTTALDNRKPAKAAAIGLISFTLIGLIAWRRRIIFENLKQRQALLVSIGGMLAMPLVIWCVGFVATPIFLGRSILFFISGFILFLVCMVCPKDAPGSRALAFGLIAAYAVSTVSFGFMREKQDWRQAIAVLEEQVGDKDIISLCPAFNYASLSHAATSPIGAKFLLAGQTGQHYLAPDGLGKYPEWAWSFLRTFEKRQETEQNSIVIPAGSVIWRIDGQCHSDGAEMAQQDALFERFSGGEEIWSQIAKYNDHISIYRYGVSQTIEIPVAEMVR